jgi:hypothetical protein
MCLVPKKTRLLCSSIDQHNHVRVENHCDNKQNMNYHNEIFINISSHIRAKNIKLDRKKNPQFSLQLYVQNLIYGTAPRFISINGTSLSAIALMFLNLRSKHFCLALRGRRRRHQVALSVPFSSDLKYPTCTFWAPPIG